jgi:signal transduction histidine kinase
MNTRDITAVMPLLILAAAPVAIMLVIAVRRSHILTFALSAGAVVAALAAIPLAATLVPRQVSALLIIDAYALFFTGLILLAGLFVLLLSYDYLKGREESREEFYLLLLTALLGAAILTASSHFASFFLGLEVLSVSLYALIAYLRINALCIEVPDSRGLLVCHPALRDGSGLFPLGNPHSVRRRTGDDCGRIGGSCPHGRDGPDHRRDRFQAGRRPVSHVGARHL